MSIESTTFFLRCASSAVFLPRRASSVTPAVVVQVENHRDYRTIRALHHFLLRRLKSTTSVVLLLLRASAAVSSCCCVVLPLLPSSTIFVCYSCAVVLLLRGFQYSTGGGFYHYRNQLSSRQICLLLHQ